MRKEALINNTNSFQLVPNEINSIILSFLSINDWNSLFYVNSQWRQLIIAETNFYLNSIMDKIDTTLSYNIAPTLEEFCEKLNKYKENGAFIGYANALLQLVEEVNGLNSPLAKLIHFDKKISEIEKSICNYCDKFQLNSIFNSPPKYRLIEIIQSLSKDKELRIMKQAWFLKATQYVRLSIEHPVSKHFTEAYLEIKKLSDITNSTEMSNKQS